MADSSRIILVIEDKQTNRDSIEASVKEEHGDRYVVYAGETIDAALQAVSQMDFGRVAVVALDLDLGFAGGPERTVQSIGRLRGCFPRSRILAYSTLRVSKQVEGAAKQADADRVCLVDDLGAVITEILLENELRDLVETSPLVNRILQTINIGISIQNRDRKLVWANLTTLKEAGIRNLQAIVGSDCWRCYHSFEKRDVGCKSCMGICLLDRAQKLIKKHRPNGVTGWRDHRKLRDSGNVMLLPLRQEDGSLRVGRVEVDSSVFLNDQGTSLLALIEATRFTTDEWEENDDDHVRLWDVLEAARDMTEYREGFAGCPAVSVYYRPENTANWHLFHSVRGPRVKLEAVELVRGQASEAFAEVEKNRVPGVHTSGVPDRFEHYIWVPRERPEAAELVVDVRLPKNEIDQTLVDVLDQDLVPYWQYVSDCFKDAVLSREKTAAKEMEEYLRKFRAEAAKGEEYPDDIEEEEQRLLDAAVSITSEALKPHGVHIRLLNRSANTLTMRAGVGYWYEHAPPELPLREPFGGSTAVARDRSAQWKAAILPEQLLPGLRREPTDEDLRALQDASGFGTLPMMFAGRVLGTFTVICRDDTLFVTPKHQFIEDVCQCLAAALGKLAWLHEQRMLVGHFHKLDVEMFGDDATEVTIAVQATSTLFELTWAGYVSYHRYNGDEDCFELVAGKPGEMGRLHKFLPGSKGLVGEVRRSGKVRFARDYLAEEWKSIREGLLESMSNADDRAAAAQVGSLVVAPVLVNRAFEGVIVASSHLPNWLSNGDRDMVREFAFKLGVCLNSHRDHREVRAELARSQAELERCQALDELHKSQSRVVGKVESIRRFLLEVTAKEFGIGFSRVILFLRDGPSDRYPCFGAIGAMSPEEARNAWKRASVPLDDKIAAFLTESPQEMDEALNRALLGVELTPVTEGTLFSEIAGSDGWLHRLPNDAHLVNNPVVRGVLSVSGCSGEYGVASLGPCDDPVGVVMVDRAFLSPSGIPAGARQKLARACNRLALRLLEIERRRREEEIEETLLWGLAYRLRTRASAVKGRLTLLKRQLGTAPPGELTRLERSVDFLLQVGTLAGKQLRAGFAGESDTLSLKEVITGILTILDDPRIDATGVLDGAQVFIDRGRLEDLLVELLSNAQYHALGATGGAWIRLWSESDGLMTTIHVQDNGQGIRPDVRDKLLKEYVTSRPDGLGFGMLYAQKIVQAAGGTIQETSEPGEGAHFAVCLPARSHSKETEE